jgi:hypothetical protein
VPNWHLWSEDDALKSQLHNVFTSMQVFLISNTETPFISVEHAQATGHVNFQEYK